MRDWGSASQLPSVSHSLRWVSGPTCRATIASVSVVCFPCALRALVVSVALGICSRKRSVALKLASTSQPSCRAPCWLRAEARAETCLDCSCCFVDLASQPNFHAPCWMRLAQKLAWIAVGVSSIRAVGPIASRWTAPPNGEHPRCSSALNFGERGLRRTSSAVVSLFMPWTCGDMRKSVVQCRCSHQLPHMPECCTVLLITSGATCKSVVLCRTSLP